MKSLLLSMLLVPAIVMAADEAKPKKPGHKPNPEAAFKKLDTNSDGSVSLEEFKAGPMGKKDPAKAGEVFKKRDKDSDGKLTLEEFKAQVPKKGGKQPAEPKKEGDPAPAAPAEPAAPAAPAAK